MSDQDKENEVNGGDTNKLVIGLKNNLSINDNSTTLTTNNNSNSNGITSKPPLNSSKDGISQPQQQQQQSTFKPVVPNKSNRTGALSPLLGVKEKQKSVSFSPMVVEFDNDNNNVNSNNNSNNQRNNSYSSSSGYLNNNSYNSNSNSNDNNSINSSQLNSQNINSFLSNLNDVSNERSKQTFNKLQGNSEIFQFDEEYEDELKEIEEKQQLQNNQQTKRVDGSTAINSNSTSSGGGNSIMNNTTPTSINNNNSQHSDDDDDGEPTAHSSRDANRSRSNGLMQELKLGTSLPVQIPSRVTQSQQSVPKNTLAAIDFSENEKKKYVTPRQSWVDTMDKDNDMAASFAVPLSLSRKPKSFI